MIEDTRLRELSEDPSGATPEEVAELARFVLRWNPVNEYVHETLKAIYINAKEAAERSLELDVITAASRSAMKRMKSAKHSRK